MTLLGVYALPSAVSHPVIISAVAGRDVWLAVNSAAVTTVPSPWTTAASRVFAVGSYLFHLDAADHAGGNITVTLTLSGARAVAAVAYDTEPTDGVVYASLVTPVNLPGSSTWGTGLHTFPASEEAQAVWFFHQDGNVTPPAFSPTGYDQLFSGLGDSGWAGTGNNTDEGVRVVIASRSNVGFTADGVGLTIDQPGPTGSAVGMVAFNTTAAPATLDLIPGAPPVALVGAAAPTLTLTPTLVLTPSAAGALAAVAAPSLVFSAVTTITPPTVTEPTTITPPTVTSLTDLALTPATAPAFVRAAAPSLIIGQLILTPGTAGATVTATAPTLLLIPEILPPDPMLSAPREGPCQPWTTIDEVRNRCVPAISTTELPDEAITFGIDLASLVLWGATGRRYGLCLRTIRPCYDGLDGCGCDLTSWLTSYGPLDRTWVPGCGCTLPELILPGPIASLVSVIADGVAVPPAALRIKTAGPNARHAILRVDGESWWCSNDLYGDPTVIATDGGSPAWQVTYWQGRPVPDVARGLAALLAEQFARGFCGGQCDDRMVPGLTRISRRGVTREYNPADLKDPVTGQTRTGLPGVDAWISSVNPHGLVRRSAIIRPDDPARLRLWSWIDETGATGTVPPTTPTSAAPLFIPDGGTATATVDGQIVYAGASTVIQVAPGVRWIHPVAWAAQTPWALGTTPTIVQNGTTMHPTASAELLEGAGGDLLVAALDGTAWHVAGANTGGGPVASTTQEILATAGEPLSAMRVVRLGAAGTVVLFEPVPANAGLVLGVTRTAGATGQQVAVVTSGTLDGATGIVPQTAYYAAAGGTLTSTRPTSGLLVTIGYGGDGDTFVVQVSDSVELA